MSEATEQQAAPTGNGTPVWPLVIKDMEERNAVGTIKYGTPLKTHNGRKSLTDAYQESLDQTVYLRQAIAEENDRKARLQIKFATMRRDGIGLMRGQEDEVLAALGWERSL